MRFVLVPAIVATMLAGCASRTVPVPEITETDPDRGLVKLTHAYGPDESPEADWERARAKALRQCRQWGYDQVQPRGDPDRECRADNRYRKCTRYFVTRIWECGKNQQEASPEPKGKRGGLALEFIGVPNTPAP